MCQGFNLSTLIAKAVYLRPPCSDPDHSGLVITGTGLACVSAKVIRFPSLSKARSVSFCPVLFSRALNPATAILPLVVPDNARIVSHASTSLASDGLPAPTPVDATPLLCFSNSISGRTLTGTPFVFVPRMSTSGPSAAIFSPICV